MSDVEEVTQADTTETTPETVDHTPTSEVTDTTPEPVQEAEANTENVFDEAYVKKLREEAATNRVKRREAEQQHTELIEAVRKLTGDATPEMSIEEQLTRAVEERDQMAKELAQLRADNALQAAITQHGGKAEILAPYLKGTGQLAQLDPSGEDYATQIGELVKTTLDTYPTFRTQVAPRNSGQSTTPSGHAVPQITHSDLEDMSSEEIVAAHRAGKLNHLFKK